MRLSGTKRALLRGEDATNFELIEVYSNTTVGTRTVTAPYYASKGVVIIRASGQNGVSGSTGAGMFPGTGGNGGRQGGVVIGEQLTAASDTYTYTLGSNTASFWGTANAQVFGSNTGANGGTVYGSFTEGYIGKAGSNPISSSGGNGGPNVGQGGGSGALNTGTNGNAATQPGCGGGGGAGGVGIPFVPPGTGGAGGGPQIQISWYKEVPFPPNTLIGIYSSTITNTVVAPLGAKTALVEVKARGGNGGLAATAASRGGGGGEGASASKTVSVVAGSIYSFTIGSATGDPSYWGVSNAQVFGANAGTDGGSNSPTGAAGIGGVAYGAYDTATTGNNGVAGGLPTPPGSYGGGTGGGVPPSGNATQPGAGGGGGIQGISGGGGTGGTGKITIHWYS